MRRVALTGGIATGKTHVRRMFEALDVPTCDLDRLAREAVAPGTEGLAEIVSVFGPQTLDAAGALDRRKLGALVFTDPAARRRLEAIVHPYVRAAMERWYASLDPANHPFALADVPLLFETGLDARFDAVIVTACEPETQVTRIMARDGLTESEARARIATQLPIQAKADRADYVIRTDGTFAETEAQVARVYEALGGRRP